MRPIHFTVLLLTPLLLISCAKESSTACTDFEPFFGPASCTSSQTYRISNLEYIQAGQADTVFLPAQDGLNIFNTRPWQIDVFYDTTFIESKTFLNSIHIEFESVPDLHDTLQSETGRLRLTSDTSTIVPLHLDSAWVTCISESDAIDQAGKTVGKDFAYSFRFVWDGNTITGSLSAASTPFRKSRE